MDSITKTRPTHYDILGLGPSASEADVGRAFARAMSPLRPKGPRDIAAASVAYEALRDPLRRRAYDVSIGLRPEKDPVPATPQGWQQVGVMHAGPVAAVPVRAIVPTPEPEARASREEMAEIAPPPRAALVTDHRLLGIEEGGIQWKRPAVVIGSMFATVAAIGVAAGLWASRDVAPQKAEAATVAVKHEEVRPMAASEAPAIAPAVAVAPPERREAVRRPVPAKPKAALARPSAAIIAAEQEALGDQAEALRADEAPEIPTEQVAAQASGVSPGLPLSNAAIARTLGKIGYACGKVASTEAVGGAFKVNCTSGHSYKAAPVRGRYHFRRWSGQ